jgi:hypothetical protein
VNQNNQHSASPIYCDQIVMPTSDVSESSELTIPDLVQLLVSFTVYETNTFELNQVSFSSIINCLLFSCVDAAS